MSKLKVLHITPWFPNEDNQMEGVFVWEHVKSLNPFVENWVVHIKFGNKSSKKEDIIENTPLTQITLKPIVDKWLFKEKKAAKLIDKIITTHQENCDLVNFHIAYPNAINIGELKKKFTDLKFVITEHWTAYHHNFNLAENSAGKKRMAAMFHHNIPVITVSNALAEDIQRFSNTTNYKSYIVPNIIRTDLFKYIAKDENVLFTFASINNWNTMKNPEILIQAFHQLTLKNDKVRLVLGGDGFLLPKMKEMVNNLNISDKVDFKGRISKEEVAKTLQASKAYVQCSNYETFSVITAEALATGTPVITTKIGGILDFVNDSNGILVEGMVVSDWTSALEEMIDNYKTFNFQEISATTQNRFNISAVGKSYFDVLTTICNEG